MPTPGLVFQPATYQGMQRGINEMVDVIRPTLGPYPRHVIYEKPDGAEILDEGGVIARRIIQVRDPDQDMGAMYLRQMLWQLHQKVGDGTATAAVLFQTVYNQGIRYIVAGGNAMRLRQYLTAGMLVMLDTLTGMTTPVDGKRQLTQVAQSICYDEPLAAMLGEIFDIIGEYGRLDIRSGQGRELEREYVEGMYWKGGVLSRSMIMDHTRFVTEMENATIFISDLEVEDPRDLVPVLTTAIRAGHQNLLLILKKISDNGMALLLSDQTRERIKTLAVKIDGYTLEDQAAAQQDLALLTGARPVLGAAGQTLKDVRPEDFGRARWVWADRHNFGLTGGRGDPRHLRQHVADLRSAYKHTTDNDHSQKLRERIGKLMGGSATLHIGGINENVMKQRKALAERTAQALRGAIAEGVVPGGGMALLACRPALQACLDASAIEEERAAYNILLQAVEAPLRALLHNAGYDPSEIMAQVKHAGPDFGFDVAAKQIVKMSEAGIVDVATVQKAAVHSAIASAALGLTVDVLVHHKSPQMSTEP